VNPVCGLTPRDRRRMWSASDACRSRRTGIPPASCRDTTSMEARWARPKRFRDAVSLRYAAALAVPAAVSHRRHKKGPRPPASEKLDPARSQDGMLRSPGCPPSARTVWPGRMTPWGTRSSAAATRSPRSATRGLSTADESNDARVGTTALTRDRGRTGNVPGTSCAEHAHIRGPRPSFQAASAPAPPSFRNFRQNGLCPF